MNESHESELLTAPLKQKICVEPIIDPQLFSIRGMKRSSLYGKDMFLFNETDMKTGHMVTTVYDY